MEKVYTIGFTKKTAEQFFETLKTAGVRRVLDVRLNNTSHLAGFTKRKDLAYFLRVICDAEYVHEPRLAPTKELIDAYKKRKGAWDDYERGFIEIMTERRVEDQLDRGLFRIPTALLCSEPKADHCHRRLVLEYLRSKWGDIEIIHL